MYTVTDKVQYPILELRWFTEEKFHGKKSKRKLQQRINTVTFDHEYHMEIVAEGEWEDVEEVVDGDHTLMEEKDDHEQHQLQMGKRLSESLVQTEDGWVPPWTNTSEGGTVQKMNVKSGEEMDHPDKRVWDAEKGWINLQDHTEDDT